MHVVPLARREFTRYGGWLALTAFDECSEGERRREMAATRAGAVNMAEYYRGYADGVHGQLENLNGSTGDYRRGFEDGRKDAERAAR